MGTKEQRITYDVRVMISDRTGSLGFGLLESRSRIVQVQNATAASHSAAVKGSICCTKYKAMSAVSYNRSRGSAVDSRTTCSHGSERDTAHTGGQRAEPSLYTTKCLHYPVAPFVLDLAEEVIVSR